VSAPLPRRGLYASLTAGLQVNTQFLTKKYRAECASGACCFCLITVIATLLLPLFFGLASGCECVCGPR
jgi:hypothetical protein